MAPTSQQAKAAKSKLLAGGKAPKARVTRYLKTTESQLREGARSSLLSKGIRCSQAMSVILKDLRSIQAPHAKLLTKTNAIVGFETEGQQSLEFLCTKNDCSMFGMASHNKKRPNNLCLGRTFDRQILDMVELGIVRYRSLQDYGGQVPKKRIGSKPMMLFIGDAWQHDAKLKKLQNLLIDFYKGDPVEKLIVSGLDHIMTFTTTGVGIHQNNVDTNSEDSSPLVHQRTYFCKLKKNPHASNSKTPIPFLVPCGPDMDFEIRRTQMASPELWKAALKQPHSVRRAHKKTKNQSTNLFGERIGRLHLERQDVEHRQGRKSKALRRAEKTAAKEEEARVEMELSKEKQEMGQEFEQIYGFAEEETEHKPKFGGGKAK